MLITYYILFLLNLFLKAHGELRLVQVIFRHGQRMPDHYINFPTDPPELRVHSPYQLGELTNSGIRQLYSLGLHLREQYGPFLNFTYIPSEVRAIAGNDNRTVVSGAAVLAGLFPPNNNQIWSDDLNWQPIPVHTDEIIDEIAFGTMLDCCSAIADKVFPSQAVTQFYDQNRHFIEFLEKKSGIPLPNIRQVDTVIDALKIRNSVPSFGMSLPYWARDAVFMDYVRQWADNLHSFVNSQPQVKPYIEGWLLNQLMGNVENSIKNATSHKLVLFSGHDDNLMALSSALNLSKVRQHLPSFAAYIALELHKSASGNYFIEVYYRANETADREELEINNCSSVSGCTLERFLALSNTRPVSSDQWAVICHGPLIQATSRAINSSSSSAAESNQPNPETSILWILICLCVLCSILLVSLLCTCRQLSITRGKLTKIENNQERRPLLQTFQKSGYLL